MTQKKSLQPTLDRALSSLLLMSVMGRQRPPRRSAAPLELRSAMRS